MSSEQKLGLEIMRISTLIRRCADNTIPLQQVNNITGSNGWILQFLAEHEGENVFQRDLQNSFSVTRSTISKVVKLMESKGLIRRESVFSDARLKKLVLTDRGRKIHQLASAGNNELEARMTRGFSQEEMETLMSLLVRISKNLEDE